MPQILFFLLPLISAISFWPSFPGTLSNLFFFSFLRTFPWEKLPQSNTWVAFSLHSSGDVIRVATRRADKVEFQGIVRTNLGKSYLSQFISSSAPPFLSSWGSGRTLPIIHFRLLWTVSRLQRLPCSLSPISSLEHNYFPEPKSPRIPSVTQKEAVSWLLSKISIHIQQMFFKHLLRAKHCSGKIQSLDKILSLPSKNSKSKKQDETN